MTERHSVVAFLTTAYQSLCFLEYVKENEVDGGNIFQTYRPDRSPRARLHNTLMHAPGFHVRTRQARGFWSRSPEHQVVAVADEIAAQIGPPPSGVRLVTGDYRDPVPWILARRWGLEADEVVVLDDGMWNASLRRGPGSEIPEGWHDVYRDPAMQPLPAATFFTSFGDQAQFAADDRVVRNEWPWLKRRYRSLEKVGSVVLLIGNPFAQYAIMDREDERKVTADLLAAARRLYPDDNLLYAAHEREDVPKLQELAAECDVVRFDVPLELVPLETGILPRAVVGNVSTALTSLADLAGGLIKIHAQRLDVDAFIPRMRENVSNIYRTMEESYADSIEIVD